MKYVKLTDPPQKVRVAATGGGPCLQVPAVRGPLLARVLIGVLSGLVVPSLPRKPQVGAGQ